VRGAPPSLTLESCFADSRQDYIVRLIEAAEAAQLRYQSPKQFRPDHNEQRYHEPECQSHECAGSYSAPKHLLFAGRHFNLPKAWEFLPHSRSTVTVQTIISPVSYKARPSRVKRPKIQTETLPSPQLPSGRSPPCQWEMRHLPRGTTDPTAQSRKCPPAPRALNTHHVSAVGYTESNRRAPSSASSSRVRQTGAPRAPTRPGIRWDHSRGWVTQLLTDDSDRGVGEIHSIRSATAARPEPSSRCLNTCLLAGRWTSAAPSPAISCSYPRRRYWSP
jgi:hypothetical protein